MSFYNDNYSFTAPPPSMWACDLSLVFFLEQSMYPNALFILAPPFDLHNLRSAGNNAVQRPEEFPRLGHGYKSSFNEETTDFVISPG